MKYFTFNILVTLTAAAVIAMFAADLSLIAGGGVHFLCQCCA